MTEGRKNDNSCTERSEDWYRFTMALIGRYPGEARHSNPILAYVLAISHTAKNILVEELRRWGFKINGVSC